MTALKPLENRRVRGVAAERYPLNEICAHPGCAEKAVDPHHLFPRSEIGGDSWFVKIDDIDPTGVDAGIPSTGQELRNEPLPHVTGLCREHHDDLEEHRAWVKLEDGSWNWYVRKDEEWLLRGKLNPPPGSQEGKPKPKRSRRKEGAERRARRTWSLRVPAEEKEDGAGLLDDAIEQLEEQMRPGEEPRSAYYTVMDALNHTLLHG